MGFDGALWRAQHSSAALEQDNPRIEMVSTLNQDVLVPGMARDEILILLGPPEYQDREADYYELGRSPLGVDYEQLVIQYKNGKLVQVAVQRS